MTKTILHINLPDQFRGKSIKEWSQKDLYVLYTNKYKHQNGMSHISFGEDKTVMIANMCIHDASNKIKYYYFKYRNNIRNKMKENECPICLSRIRIPKFVFTIKNVNILYCLECIVRYIENMKKAYDPSTRIKYTVKQVRHMEESAKENDIKCESLLKICFGIESSNDKKEKLLRIECVDGITLRMSHLTMFMVRPRLYRQTDILEMLSQMQHYLMTLRMMDRNHVHYYLMSQSTDIQRAISQECNYRAKIKLKDLNALIKYYLNVFDKLPIRPLNMNQLHRCMRNNFSILCAENNVALFTVENFKQFIE